MRVQGETIEQVRVREREGGRERKQRGNTHTHGRLKRVKVARVVRRGREEGERRREREEKRREEKRREEKRREKRGEAHVRSLSVFICRPSPFLSLSMGDGGARAHNTLSAQRRPTGMRKREGERGREVQAKESRHCRQESDQETERA